MTVCHLVLALVHEILGQQVIECLVQPQVHDSFDIDLSPLDQRLIELPALDRLGCSISLLQTPGQGDRHLDVLFDRLPADFDIGKSSAGVSHLLGDQVLLVFQKVRWHGAAVVGVHQLAPLGLEGNNALTLLVGLSLNRRVGLSQRRCQHLGYLTLPVVGQLNRAVVTAEGLIDCVDWNMWQVTRIRTCRQDAVH
ncbi:MAG TPA: hypothetical protein VGP46_06850 [Acidimicrobiales bacterium]|nr:hypothetical protein [Acidimicrobiales bacterium]